MKALAARLPAVFALIAVAALVAGLTQAPPAQADPEADPGEQLSR